MHHSAAGDVREHDAALASLGHDMRNALNAMTAALAVLELFPRGSGEAREAQQVVARQAARLRALVDEHLPMR